MPLTAGDKLGPYEILAPIGAGGMGEVYRARDPRLGRDVAIKISAERFTERFEREARAIASLNHPNICTLHDVGPNYLVMELVEGPTLAERLKQDKISLEESLNIACQIADALEAAHEKGITHRDLKPGNVKIKPDGTVKVLDFGLAKIGGTPTAQSDHSPTITIGQTEAGMILGTAAYMSPEQAKGKQVDQRADIYSFGVVLYEMVTGTRLHHGETTTEVLASVLKEEPRWDKVPPQVQRLLRRCLEKDPQKRQRHIGDAMALVDDAPPASVTTEQPRKNRWLWPAAIVAGLAVVGSALAYLVPWRGKGSTEAIRFQIPSTDDIKFILGGFPAISPNSKWIVFPATGSDNVTRMYLRALDSVEVRPLVGTESPTNLPPPVFWSPDSRFIGFSTGAGNNARGQLKKLDISGGPAQILCDTPAAVPGGAWNRDGVIIMGNNAGVLLRVSAAGGVATPMTVVDASRKEIAHRWPQFLPDGRHFIYYRASSDPQLSGVYVGSLDAKPQEQSLKPLLLTDRQAVYSPSANGGPGMLLFMRNDALFAQPFDPGRLELSGEAVPVANQVGSFALANAALFSVSETGALAYRIGGGGNLGRILQLAWFDAEGKVVGNLGEAGLYDNPAISPDGVRVAVAQYDGSVSNSNIWVMDTSRGTSARLTFGRSSDDNPVWSPDGRNIIFSSNRSGHYDLYQKAADGSGDERLLLKSDEDKRPTSWSQDGRFLLYTNVNTKTYQDLWVLPMEGDRKPFLFLRTEFNEFFGRFSPDGKWIAYTSDESGTNEVYVRPFRPNPNGEAAGGGKWLVSKGGGVFPRWNSNGKELYYVNFLQLSQMVVDVATDKTFQAGVSRRVFGVPPILGPSDVTSDGKKFLFASVGDPGANNTATPFNVVLNWQAGLKK